VPPEGVEEVGVALVEPVAGAVDGKAQGQADQGNLEAVRVPFRMAIIRGTPAIVTGSERELWKAISNPSTSDCATSERRSGGEVEEGADECRGGEGDGQPEDDADALSHGRAALSEGEA
jgi:hypothetical protein